MFRNVLYTCIRVWRLSVMLSSEWEKNVTNHQINPNICYKCSPNVYLIPTPESPPPPRQEFFWTSHLWTYIKSPQNQCVKTTLYTRRLPSRVCCFDKYKHDQPNLNEKCLSSAYHRQCHCISFRLFHLHPKSDYIPFYFYFEMMWI